MSISGLIAARVSEENFDRWFSETSVEAVDEHSVTLAVPNSIHQFWIETNFLGIVEEAVLTVIGPREIRFHCTEELDEGRAAPEATAAPTAGESPTHPMPVPAPAPARRPARDPAEAAGLNPRYTFGSFVVGQKNQFAAAACQAAAARPGARYNPLFIFGGVGLGKTHLMHAIGHQVLADNPRARVVYVSSEQFVNEFIQALQDGSLTRFRRRYRTPDLLLIDDIQFLAGKEHSQAEFFHTFNTLSDGRKQIVLSCDRPAGEIANLQKRLLSRFEWGMTAQLAAPEQETRMAILRKKLEEWQVSLRPEVVEFIASRIRQNVRRLEGALIRVLSYFSLERVEEGTTDWRAIEDILADFLQGEAIRHQSPQDVQKVVADFYDLRVSDLTGRKRPALIAHARQVAMYLCRQRLRLSYQEIGESFGGREHGTVMHACRKIDGALRSREEVRRDVRHLDDRLQRGS